MCDRTAVFWLHKLDAHHSERVRGVFCDFLSWPARHLIGAAEGPPLATGSPKGVCMRWCASGEPVSEVSIGSARRTALMCQSMPKYVGLVR